MPKIKFEFRVVLIYLILGCLWILFSDRFLEFLLKNPEKVLHAQTYKGWFYVVFTAGLFYYYLKRYLKKLRATEQNALESDRLKSTFLSNMSHEIRTPMNGIIGFSKLLANPDLTVEEQRECARVIEESGTRMLTIINDLIAISKLESGKMSLNISEIDVDERVKYLFDLMKPQVENKGIQFVLNNTLADEKSIIKSDRDKVTYVLKELLQNSIKYCEKGSIEFGFDKKGRNICFFVKDTGIGIPESQQKMIFDRFTQVDQSYTKPYEGVGLGLSIAKAYVELLGGKIWVKSNEGTGSTFYFTVPFQMKREQ